MKAIRFVSVLAAAALLGSWAWGQGPAAGSSGGGGEASGGPAVKQITSFERDNPFTAPESKQKPRVVAEHATDGGKALELSESYITLQARQDWSAYDYLKVDVFTGNADPVTLALDIRDAASKDYWTRVNYTTIVPPGKSTVIIPLKQLYVGEKSRPGRMLDLANITTLAFVLHSKPSSPLFLDNVRLERDEQAIAARFPGLWAFDFQPKDCPVMEGFTPVLPDTTYTAQRHFGLKNATVQAENAFQPDPLYQDCLNIVKGSFVVDVPNGTYRVWMNINRPPLFWGQVQRWTQRTVAAQGKQVLRETQTEDDLRQRYYANWNNEDLPSDNTFDKYQSKYDEKSFEVEVSDGQLVLDFASDAQGCSVSALVVYPIDKAEQGQKFLQYLQDHRRFHFDNYSKRILPKPAGPVNATDADRQHGYMVFNRSVMADVNYNAIPAQGEITTDLKADAFAGEYAPLSLAILPLQDLGTMTVTGGDLTGPAGLIEASAVQVGFVSYRLARVSGDGTVYTIAPRYIMPSNAVAMPKDMTRRFWITVKTPADAKPGTYQGKLTLKPEKGQPSEVAVQLRVRRGTLEEVDIPAGPFGGSAQYVELEKCLAKLREYGFTTYTAGPSVAYKGFKDGKPQLDFSKADALMAQAKQMGFKGVVFYSTLVGGYNAYFQDPAAMKAAGFSDYSAFIKALYTPIQQHAEAAGWLPCFINLGDEPIGEAVIRAAENVEAYRKAFPKGPPNFGFCTSLGSTDPKDPHVRLSKGVEIPTLNGHTEEAVKMLKDAGNEWSYYNGGNRWTFGDYMYKAAQQWGMKFRVSWHWNNAFGDPYYPLDSREDEYVWCNSAPDGTLIPTVAYERLREGLGDYRRLLTLQRLAKAKSGTAEAQAAEKLIADRMGAFKLGQRDHDALFGADDWSAFRTKVNDAIESLR